MQSLRNCLERLIVCSGLLTTFCLFGSSASATAENVTVGEQHGLREITFKTGNGKVDIYLPVDIAPGDTVSGTISIANKSLNDYWLQVGNQKIGTCLDHFKFSAPQDGGSITASLTTNRGKVVGETIVPFAREAQRQSNYTIDSFGQDRNLLKCNGPFDGDLSSTTVSVNGQNCLLVSESPRQLCFIAPPGLTGQVEVKLTESGVTSTFSINLISVTVKGPLMSLLPGSRSRVAVEVGGLAGASHTAQVKVVNLNPGVVELEGGNDQLLNIPAGYSTFTKSFVVRGLREGYYSISAFLWRY